jgi:hypothetical protein
MMFSDVVRPWRSVDASGWMYGEDRWVKSDLSTYDDQAQIDLCLRCPFAGECVDCVTEVRKAQKPRLTAPRRKKRLAKQAG